MIIHRPRIYDDAPETCVSARIELETPGVEAPDELWFRFPASYRPYLTDAANGFLVGLLPTAMCLGESVRVAGDVSPQLAYGLRVYQQIQNAWWPDRFSKVEVELPHLRPATRATMPGAVASTMSGGVDSSYTLWTHRPDHEPLPEYRLTHSLLINGYDFDVDLDNTGHYQRIFDYYKPLAANAGIELLTSRTNLRVFRLLGQKRAPLRLSLEAPIAASVHVLGNLMSRFYLPASDSYRYESMIPRGGHPVLVHLLGTETLQMISDGGDASRVEKIAVIAEWPDTYSRLRVCWRTAVFNATSGLIENCGRCEKCVRTMLSLELLGAIDRYRTFPHRLRRRDIWRTSYVTPSSRIFWKENVDLARKVGRRDRAVGLRLAIWRSRLARLKAKLLHG
jgi:hypothetical protein